MPATIFDAAAANAAHRDAEFRWVLEDMAQHAYRRAHRSTAVTHALAPDAPLPNTCTNLAFEELADLERWYVIERAGWEKRIAWLVEFYRDGTFGFRLWWKASREFIHRVAALEFLPEIARRLAPIATDARDALVGQMMRALPGETGPHTLLAASRGHLVDDGSPLEGVRGWLVAFWRASDPELLMSLATLPAAARAEPGRLFAWSAYEVAQLLAACHREHQKVPGHITTVLEAGGWGAELRSGNTWDMHVRVREAIAREVARREQVPGSLFDR